MLTDQLRENYPSLTDFEALQIVSRIQNTEMLEYIGETLFEGIEILPEIKKELHYITESINEK